MIIDILLILLMILITMAAAGLIIVVINSLQSEVPDTPEPIVPAADMPKIEQ